VGQLFNMLPILKNALAQKEHANIARVDNGAAEQFGAGATKNPSERIA
jgi:hypothetical protein